MTTPPAGAGALSVTVPTEDSSACGVGRAERKSAELRRALRHCECLVGDRYRCAARSVAAVGGDHVINFPIASPEAAVRSNVNPACAAANSCSPTAISSGGDVDDASASGRRERLACGTDDIGARTQWAEDCAHSPPVAARIRPSRLIIKPFSTIKGLG